jgi:hypothetical protein
MSATMARQAGRVQLEQSNMHLALNMAKMAKEGFSRTAIEETKYLIKNPRTEVREEKKRGVECPGYKKVKSVIQRHPAILRHKQTSGCFLCQNGTPKHPQTGWRHKGTVAPPLTRCRVRTPEPTTPPPSTSPAPTGNTSGAQPSEIVNLLAGYTNPHTALPCAEFFEDDQDTEHDTDLDPDMLTDDG